eukprot:11644857-Heterocapsa_arctica.AAC.1
MGSLQKQERAAGKAQDGPATPTGLGRAGHGQRGQRPRRKDAAGISQNDRISRSGALSSY